MTGFSILLAQKKERYFMGLKKHPIYIQHPFQRTFWVFFLTSNATRVCDFLLEIPFFGHTWILRKTRKVVKAWETSPIYIYRIWITRDSYKPKCFHHMDIQYRHAFDRKLDSEICKFRCSTTWHFVCKPCSGKTLPSLKLTWHRP